MVEGIHRPTIAKINLKAIQTNYINLKKYLPEGIKIYAVVKSNGYGHGAVPVSKALSEVGADAFGVAITDEALELREAGLQEPILVLSLSEPVDAPVLAEQNIMQTVMSIEWLEEAKTHLIDSETKEPLKVHLNFDSGMNRIGVKSFEQGQEILDYLAENKDYFYLDGIFTHLATTDALDERSFAKTEEQLDLFSDFRTQIDVSAFDQNIQFHQANSALSILQPDKALDAVRVGAILYGLAPFETEYDLPFELEQALTIETELVNVKQMHAGETVSYGATYETKEGEWIGTIPIGYGDGWLRQYIGKNTIVDGEFAPTVGRICMDQAMISLPHEVAIGSKVTLVGGQEKKYVTVEDISDTSGSMNCEFTNLLGTRIHRVYI